MDGSLPKNVKKVFTDIGTLSADINRRLSKIIGFQKFQKSIQLKMENKRSAMRKEQIGKIEKKTQEFSGQLTKLSSFEESNRKKLEDTEKENEKLKHLIKSLELEIASAVPLADSDNEDDFFLKNTPTSSNPSVAGSITDNEDMFEFDLLGLKNRSDSSSSSCSSQSNRAGSLF
ncbi:hypothetical protein GCK72_002574 [Caenorhabditis remanei]|nr:hypothetical protein GCK72_002574 [Caenorhabditis remanei]KAF1770751.1 hypothetical protein GCK72_002574 [Caenorhabditis remanei]